MATQQFTSAVATPGTIQRITAGASPALATISGGLAGSITPRGTAIIVTADPGNTASKTLFIGGPALSVSGNSGWSQKLAPGASAVIASSPEGIVDTGDFWVDTDGTTAKYGVEVVG